MTKVFKVQEKDFMRNAVDSRLRRYDGFFLCTLISLMLKNIFTGLPRKLTFARNDKGIQNAMDSRLRGNDGAF